MTTFETFVASNFKRIHSDLYQKIDSKIYFTWEQVQHEYAKYKFRLKKIDDVSDEKKND